MCLVPVCWEWGGVCGMKQDFLHGYWSQAYNEREKKYGKRILRAMQNLKMNLIRDVLQVPKVFTLLPPVVVRQGCRNRMCVVSHGNLFSHSSEGWKSSIEMVALWFLPRPLFLAHRWSPCYLFERLPLCGVCVPIYSYMGLGPTHMTPFYLNYLFKVPISKYIHNLRPWRLGLQPMNLGGWVEAQIQLISGD